MTAGPRIVVTAGPTIGVEDIHAVIPHAEVMPPISFGDALRYGLGPGDTLLIVDGLFFQSASVRHKELLTLIDDGVRVVGSSSMGALRAAELHPFGMEGYGWVFEGYRDGVIDADDEVGMVHGDPEDGYPVFVDALVNIRQTVAQAVQSGVLPPATGEQLIEIARRTPFTQRTWNRLLESVGVVESATLAKQLKDMRIDIKHADAVLALREVICGPRKAAVRPGPPPTVWSERWRQRWAPPTPVEVTPGGSDIRHITDVDVLSLLSVCATDRWAYRPALEQVAAWYRTLTHPDDAGGVRDRALRAVADIDVDDDERALETVAHHYAVASGIIDASGFPEHVRAHWLTDAESQAFGDDPISVSARLTTRTLFFTRSLPAIQHFLELLRTDPRLPMWRTMVAQALGRRDELARQKPNLNLQRPDPTQLKRLFSMRWGTEVNHIELAQRGLMTNDAFYNAASLFAVSAADDQLPSIHVGTLGGAG